MNDGNKLVAYHSSKHALFDMSSWAYAPLSDWLLTSAWMRLNCPLVEVLSMRGAYRSLATNRWAESVHDHALPMTDGLLAAYYRGVRIWSRPLTYHLYGDVYNIVLSYLAYNPPAPTAKGASTDSKEQQRANARRQPDLWSTGDFSLNLLFD
jgi:hypothetical protein